MQKKIRRAITEALEARRLLSVAATDSATIASATNGWGDNGLLISYSPPAHFIRAEAGFLTPAAKGDALDIAMSYLRGNASSLGLNTADISQSRVSSRYTDSDTGVTHIYLQQALNNLPILAADLGIHLTKDNQIINIGGGFMAGAGKLEGKASTVAQLSEISAILGAGRALQLDTRAFPEQTAANTFEDADLSLDPIQTRLVYVAREDGPKLAWNFALRLPSDWYDMAVDANNGETLWAHSWTDHATYNVYPRPTESPSFGSRSLQTDPQDLAASPFGWHDTNGVAGPEFTDTRGNNVSAQDDIDASNTGGTRPDGGTSLNFDFPVDLSQSPVANLSAATTNLFYWNNLLHDIHYQYGFTESAGSFQTNNYGNGGAGNDAVQADAQDGTGVNNANFDTPPDGFSGRMQMYVWSYTAPNRDGDFDNGIVIHEYGHGVSNRLTGGPANAGALDATQSGGMGEGWSDFWAMALTAKAGDAMTMSRPMGTYVIGQSTSGTGIRRFPYNYNMSVNPLTMDAYGTSGSTSYGVTRSTQVHRTGELWCSALWDMYSLLVQKYGFASDVETGYTTSAGAGNKLALKLVMDALKLQPANPTFAQARDAVLQADVVLTNGSNQNEIWQAFARRGMGASFNPGSSSSSLSVTAAFDMPWLEPTVIASTPSGQLIIAPSSMTFTFSEPMDPVSFSVADDILSFTGPGGANLLSQITGFTFTNSNRILTVNFNQPVAVGSYSMTIGANIASADNGHVLDQNKNSVLGEAADGFTGSFIYTQHLTDSFGYEAGPWAFENLDLDPGASDVTTVLNNTDDSAAVVPIGTNSFRFYTTTYNSSSTVAVGVNDNGFVSFGNLSSQNTGTNTDLSSPSAARIAAMWDDWVSFENANDSVVYKYEDLNNDSISDRLIVEWNDVEGYDSPGNGVTFQVILQLNTGTRPGTLIANYVDTDAGDPVFNNGVGATIGLKDTGTPPPRKFLLSFNDPTFSWIGSGKAIRFSTDWIAPTANIASFDADSPRSITYQFSEDVSSSLSASDLQLFNTTSSQSVSTAGASLNYNTATNQATFTFATPFPDGDYNLTLAASGITDASWMPMAGDVTTDFTFLNGDANRDRFVDTQDFNILAQNFGGASKIFAQGDFTFDGNVDSTDFTTFVAQYGKRLAAPSSLSAATGPVQSGSAIFAGTTRDDGMISLLDL